MTERDPYEGLPHIDENVEVLGLTDRDPEFFEKQAAREAQAALDARAARAEGAGEPKAAAAAPVDRMFRRARRKGL